MLTKTEFLAALKRESAILTHLAGRLRPKHLKFRFTKPQRSTLDLLQYLTINAQAGVGYHVTGSWDHWDKLEASSKKVTLRNFAAALKKQEKAITKQLKSLSERDFALKRVKQMGGKGTLPLAQSLFQGTLTMCIGYRMQLFLQAKAAGIADLKSSDLWFGRA